MRAQFALRSRLRGALAQHGREDVVRTSVCEPVDDPEVRLLVYPDGVWYRVPDPADVEEIVRSHLVSGEVVQRLVAREEPRRCVFVCSLDSPTCGSMGAEATRDDVRRALLEQGSDVIVLATNCLGQCSVSPNWVVYPDGVWYSRVSDPVAKRLTMVHLINGGIDEDALAYRMAVRVSPPSGSED
jgi:(2Fe-2S) ferredoxin